MTYIHNKLGLAIIGALLLMLVAALAGVIYAGPLDPPSAPGSTQETQITSLPFTISSSGSYVLTKNLTAPACSGNPSVHGITVGAFPGVTLDMRGFSLIGPGSGSGCGSGIYVVAATTDLTVKNGTLRDWGDEAIDSYFVNGSTLSSLSVRNSGTLGILGGPNTTLVDCVLDGNGFGGMQVTEGAYIRECSSTNNGGNGFAFGSNSAIHNCTATGNAYFGIRPLTYATGVTIEGCTVSSNTLGGIDLIANSNALVTGNTVSENTTDGISITGFMSAACTIGDCARYNRIEGNATNSNGGVGVYISDVGSPGGATDNVIVRNTAANNAGGNFIDSTAGPNDMPVSFAASTAGPWDNLSY